MARHGHFPPVTHGLLRAAAVAHSQPDRRLDVAKYRRSAV